MHTADTPTPLPAPAALVAGTGCGACDRNSPIAAGSLCTTCWTTAAARHLIQVHATWRAVGYPRRGTLAAGTQTAARRLADHLDISRWTLPGLLRTARTL